MQKLIILRGYPGSGKTTVGKKLAQNGRGLFIDHNSILTFIANIVGNDEGIYEDIHKLEMAMARKVLKDGGSAIVARGFGSAQSVNEYIDLGKVVRAECVVFTLSAPMLVLEKRVQSPERLDDFNPTVSPETLRDWIKGNPLEELSGEHVIDASETLETVLSNITAQLD